MPKKVAEQAVPGTVGGAFAVFYMIYGPWWKIVPPDLSQTQELALTGAVGVLAAGVVNLARWLLLPKKNEEPLDA